MAWRRRGWAVLLAAVMMSAPAELCGQSLYEQAPTISGGLFSNAGGLIAADQFALKEAAAITGIRWCGFFQNASIVLSDGEPSEFRFRITFFEDGSGIPARQISQQDVSARVRNTGVQTRFNIPGKLPIIYEFTAASLRPVAVKGGRLYGYRFQPLRRRHYGYGAAASPASPILLGLKTKRVIRGNHSIGSPTVSSDNSHSRCLQGPSAIFRSPGPDLLPGSACGPRPRVRQNL